MGLRGKAREENRVAALRRAVELCPESAEASVELAKALRAAASTEADLEEAERAARRAVAAAGHLSSSRRELEAGKEALEFLGLLLCQQDRNAEAVRVLRTLGCEYRLARGVLRYPLSGACSSPRSRCEHVSSRTEDAQDPVGSVAAYDGAVPCELMCELRSAFAPDSPFWAEHGYFTGHTGYFSYAHRIGPGAQPKTHEGLMERITALVQEVAARDFPEVREARFAEWWAHCRAHSAGHQMHFDSDDEGKVSDVLKFRQGMV